MALSLNTIFSSSLKFQESTDIELAITHPEISQAVDGLGQVYYQINTQRVMDDLTQVAGLLQLAYAGSQTFSCNPKILAIWTQYQRLINGSVLANGVFIITILKALRDHKIAIEDANDEDWEGVIQTISECGKLAKQMANQAQNLSQQSTTLSDAAESALIAASEDKYTTEKQKKEIKEALDKLKAQEASLQSKTAALAKEVNEAKEAEKRERERAEGDEKKAFVIGILSRVMEPVAATFVSPMVTVSAAIAKSLSNPSTPESNSLVYLQMLKDKKQLVEELENLQKQLDEKKAQIITGISEEAKKELEAKILTLEGKVNSKKTEVNEKTKELSEEQKTARKEADSARHREAKFSNERIVLQKEHREANATLAGLLTQLSTSKITDNDLSSAVTSLQITVGTLAKVRTTFENIRIFWMNVHTHCESLIDNKMISKRAKQERKDALISELQSSGMAWLTLGTHVLKASNSIKLVKEKVDKGISNLPNMEESQKLITETPKIMSQDLNAEIKQLDEQIKQSESNNNNAK